MISLLRSLLRIMRPKQWTKNAFLFAAVVFDRKLFNFGQGYFTTTVLGFLLFCLLSSSIYSINDVMDIEKDRKHPTKRFRPLASGKLSVPFALGAATFFLLIVFPTSFLLNMPGGPLQLCPPCTDYNAHSIPFRFGLVVS